MKPSLASRLQDEDMTFFELGFFFGKIAARAPEHRRVLAEAAAVHERAVGLVTGGLDFILVKLERLRQR